MDRNSYSHDDSHEACPPDLLWVVSQNIETMYVQYLSICRTWASHKPGYYEFHYFIIMGYVVASLGRQVTLINLSPWIEHKLGSIIQICIHMVDVVLCSTA